MVDCHVSSEIKQQVLQFHDQGWEIGNVAESMQTCLGPLRKALVAGQILTYDAGGCVDPPSILTANVIKDLRDLIPRYTSLYLDEIGEWPVLDHDQSNI